MLTIAVPITDIEKQSFSKYCLDSGLTVADVFGNFVRRVLAEKKLPDDLYNDEVPTDETMAAVEEGERIARDPSVKGYTNLDALWKDLGI